MCVLSCVRLPRYTSIFSFFNPPISSEGAALVARRPPTPPPTHSPYGNDYFPTYAEPIPSSRSGIDPSLHPSTAALSSAAAAAGAYVIGGSIPEVTPDGKLYNTCVAFGPDGEIVATHRKIHLFDIDVPGRIVFKESETLSPGSTLASFDTPYGRVGLGICYDIRFPLHALCLRDVGCKFLFYPGAFNLTTGPAHWELLLRARALDTQSFVAGVAGARVPGAKYQSWGHSTLVSPWGEVLGGCAEAAASVHVEVELGRVDEVRANIPVSKQRRDDLYRLEWVGK